MVGRFAAARHVVAAGAAPGSTLACENSTALNDEVPWRASQARVVGMFGGLGQRAALVARTWQLAQSFGVP